MHNKGLSNHTKYRTKYWQERQGNTLSNLEDTMISGQKINQPKSPLKVNPKTIAQQKRYLQASYHSKLYPKSKRSSPERDNRSGQQYKLKLKLQLQTLDNDSNFEALRKSIKSVELKGRNEKNVYLNAIMKERSDRPNTSILTLNGTTYRKEYQPQYRIRPRFLSLQQTKELKVMPLNQSRYLSICSPVL